jgi:hypothetical protein
MSGQHVAKIGLIIVFAKTTWKCFQADAQKGYTPQAALFVASPYIVAARLSDL